MSFDGVTEQEAVIARLKDQCPIFEDRVFDSLPEEQQLEKDTLGILVKPYAVVTFGPLIPRANDRSIEGPAEQPFVWPIIVESWGPRSIDARTGAGQVRVALVGWTPDEDNCDMIDLRGGSFFIRRDYDGKPVRSVETITLESSLNNSVVVP